MLFGLSVVLLSGLILGQVCVKLRLPPLIGMIAAGILIGPGALGLADESLLGISADIRRAALIVILIRAGLKTDLSALKRAGRPALLLCFVPACFEVAGTVLLAPPLLGLSLNEAAILGAVIGAVSPAVVVPRMIRLIDEGRGTDKGIPQMILAGASVDDVFVIVLFTAFTSLERGGSVDVMSFLNIPLSVLTGIAAGAAAGLALALLFRRTALSLPLRAIVLLSVSLLLNWAGDAQTAVPFAGLIAVMASGAAVRKKDPEAAGALSRAFDMVWVPSEILLFVLLGASVAVGSLRDAGPAAVLLIAGALVFRMAGAAVCTLGTGLNRRERLFCMLAYTPKATVQAAIGGLPLAMGLACGGTVLTVSVIAILLTAPLGALAIDRTCGRFLEKAGDPSPASRS